MLNYSIFRKRYVPLDNSRYNEYIMIMNERLNKQFAFQTEPATLEQRAIVDIARTFFIINQSLEELLSKAGLTLQQFNILRILRGAGPSGIPCGEVRSRMLNRDSDITRLMNRLVNSGHVTRVRTEKDRRVVLTRITEKGLKLLADLDGPIDTIDQKIVGGIGEHKIKVLIEILGQIRERKSNNLFRPNNRYNDKRYN